MELGVSTTLRLSSSSASVSSAFNVLSRFFGSAADGFSFSGGGERRRRISSSSRNVGYSDVCQQRKSEQSSSTTTTTKNSAATTERKNRIYNKPDQKLIFQRINEYRNKTAIVDKDGDFLYEDIFRRSVELAVCIRDIIGKDEEGVEKAVCFLIPNGVSYVVTQWACWLSGNVSVPLSKFYSEETLEHILKETKCSVVITTQDLLSDTINRLTKTLGQKMIVLDETWREKPKKSSDFDLTKPLPSIYDDAFYTPDRLGMILYTSGISGNPKAVPLRHEHINARLNGIAYAWDLTDSDNVLHTLPLLNTHGIINSLMAPLSVGGKVIMLNKLDATKIWSYLLNIGSDPSVSNCKVNIFPSIPAVYQKLIECHGELFETRKMREYVKTACTRKIRLMTCSSASLSVSLLDRWKAITGHSIVETYCTAESGAVFSSPIRKPRLLDREGSEVRGGSPLPEVETRVVRFLDDEKTRFDVLGQYSLKERGENENEIPDNIDKEVVGELMVRGPGIFENYLDGSKDRFYEGGWFLTGDVAAVKGGGCHRILGRINMETLRNFEKGVNVRMWDVERKLERHESVKDCCVIGFHDPLDEDKPSKLAAVVVLDIVCNKNQAIPQLLEWMRDNMESHEIPSVLKVVTELPRDNLGRVDKLKLAGEVFEEVPQIYINDNRL